MGIARHRGELRETDVELRVSESGNLVLKSARGLSEGRWVELKEEIYVQLRPLRNDEAEILKPRLIARGLSSRVAAAHDQRERQAQTPHANS